MLSHALAPWPRAESTTHMYCSMKLHQRSLVYNTLRSAQLVISLLMRLVMNCCNWVQFVKCCVVMCYATVWWMPNCSSNTPHHTFTSLALVLPLAKNLQQQDQDNNHIISRKCATSTTSMARSGKQAIHQTALRRGWPRFEPILSLLNLSVGPRVPGSKLCGWPEGVVI